MPVLPNSTLREPRATRRGPRRSLCADCDRPEPANGAATSKRIACRFALAVLSVLASPLLAQPTLGNISPVSVDFGAVKMGATVSIPVTIHNLTETPVGIASNGLNADGFALDGATCAQAGYLLPAGGACDLVVSFTPTDNTGATFSANLALLLSASAGTQSVVIRLGGSGSEHLAQVSPVGIDFGQSFIGQLVSVPVTITNTHSAPVTFSGGGVSNGPFRADSGNCPASLGAGASCSFNYGFTASDSTPAQTATTIGVVTGSPSPMQEYFAVTLKGQGSATLPVPDIAVWPLTIDFGSIGVGQDVSVLVDYKNNGALSLTQSGGGFNDDQGGTFEGFSTDVGGCTGSSIPSGAQCANQYQFLPHAAQSYTGSTAIVFSDGIGNSLFAPIAVSGIGVGTLGRVSPQSVDLGAVAFETSVSVPVVVTNTSTSPLTNFAGGSVNAPFGASNDCGASLAVGASCAFTYTFHAPSAHDAIKARYVATTLLTFTNATGIQPVVPITIAASVGDRLFGDGFDG